MKTHHSHRYTRGSGRDFASSAWSRADRASTFPRRAAPPPSVLPTVGEAVNRFDDGSIVSSSLADLAVRKTEPARGAPGAGGGSAALALAACDGEANDGKVYEAT
jgi:hypothetical protein